MLTELRPVVIITCVDYWDYLNATLPHTLKFASHVYVVTTPTQECTIKDVNIIRTDAFGSSGFNKSAAVRKAQEYVHDTHPDDWILLLDADIIVDADLGHDITCKDTLYGVSRLDYVTPEDLIKHRGEPYHTSGAGYFQLYYDKTKLYPESSEDASECDMVFYNSFDKTRILGGAVHHLGRHTVNWKGRVSPAWEIKCM
jgi:hypothetical protein